MEYGVGFRLDLEIKFDPIDLPVPCRDGEVGIRAVGVETNRLGVEQIADQKVEREEFRVAYGPEGEAEKAPLVTTVQHGLMELACLIINWCEGVVDLRCRKEGGGNGQLHYDFRRLMQ
jgi:hypothetical protein